MIQESVEERESETEALIAREYSPTPYRASRWEGFDLVDKNPAFKKISVEVIENPDQKFDPMFEQFDRKERERASAKEEDEITDEAIQPEISEEFLEEIRLQGYEQGIEDGKKQGLADAQLEIIEKYEALANSMREISGNIRDELSKKIEELERKSLDFAVELSRRVLTTTVDARPDYILDVIRNGLKHLGASKPLRVRVSPADFEFLEVVGLPEDLTMEGARLQYLPDENISAGCVVETDYGELNLEIDKMWAEVKDNLFKAIS